MKGKIFFFVVLFSFFLGVSLWAANGAYQLKGKFELSNGWKGAGGTSFTGGGYPGRVIFNVPTSPANAQVNSDGVLSGNFWLGNVGWVSFDHGVATAQAKIICPTNIINDATQSCTVTGYAWSRNAGWIVMGSGAIGVGSGVSYNPNTRALEGWGWSRALGWIPMWTGFTLATLPTTTTPTDPLAGAAVNFVSRIAIIGNIAGSRIFSVVNNATVNQDVGYSYKTINHADILNLIRKNITLMSRNISDTTLANENNTLDFFIKKGVDYTLASGALPSGKRSVIVIGGDIILNQAYINATSWGQSPIGIIALKDASGNGGNIIISKDVKRIYSYIYAEGSVYSGEKVGATISPYVQSGIWNVPQNQLYIRGLIASKNTIGGAQQKNGALLNPICPTLTPGCTSANAHWYDWDYFRNYDSQDPTQSSLPSERSSIASLTGAVMIIEYDPRILTNPPPGFRELK